MNPVSSLTGASVMVVDDTPENVHLAVRGLQSRGLRVLAFTNPRRALEAARREAPDAFVIDVAMPGMDGFELCAALRAEPTLADVPVLFLTASDDAEDKVRAFAAGAVDYVTKPVDVTELNARVHTHVTNARQRRVLDEQNTLLREAAEFREQVEAMSRHDLQSPLTTILGFSGVLLSRGTLDPQTQDLVSRIHAAGERLREQVNRSLDLFRIEQGLYDDAPVPVDLVEVVRELVCATEPLAQRHGVTLAAHLPDTSTIALADPALLFSALSNLVKNAIEAAQGGTVEVEVAQDLGRTRLSIRNDGEVPAGIRDRFFEKFVTADKHGGTGLGTYSAARSIGAMGGEVHVDCTEPGRTTIVVELVAAEVPAPGRDVAV